MEKMNVGVVGNGFVGHAMTLLRPHVTVNVWDVDSEKREPTDITFEEFVKTSRAIFVAVPTPMRQDGSCDLRIVESVVAQIKEVDAKAHIVLRSTVLPGTSKRLGVAFMPEFLTEKEWEEDFRTCKHWIIGAENVDTVRVIRYVFGLAYNDGDGGIEDGNVTWMQPTEAELVKYVKNCFLATKVSFFNEICDLCEAMDINFEDVRKMACDDKRIGHGHSQVPGHDGKKGYGGTCFPKDMNALVKMMKKLDLDPAIMSASVMRNELKDRCAQDWKNDTGRAVSED
jgi:UDPglucose 6-dehydrogenase